MLTIVAIPVLDLKNKSVVKTVKNLCHLARKKV